MCIIIIFVFQKKKENIEPEQPEKKMRPSITNVCVLKYLIVTVTLF